MIDRPVVLIAERKASHLAASRSDRTLEFLEEDYFSELCAALSKITPRLVTYDSPADYLSQIGRHKNDVVFSLWSGIRSRNRRALIPSICEAYRVPYVGADAYTHIICQDKALSKRFIRDSGLRAPLHHLVRTTADLAGLRRLKYPVVVKPNWEGGSIGISTRNLCQDTGQASTLAEELLKEFEQPILVEEFIPGREVSILLSGRPHRLRLLEAVEIDFGPLQDPTTTLYGFELKKQKLTPSSQRVVTQDLDPRTLSQAVNLFRQLDKVDIMRVDGRLTGDLFHCIELSPDVHIGKTSGFTIAYASTHKMSYSAMLEDIIAESLASQV